MSDINTANPEGSAHRKSKGKWILWAVIYGIMAFVLLLHVVISLAVGHLGAAVSGGPFALMGLHFFLKHLVSRNKSAQSTIRLDIVRTGVVLGAAIAYTIGGAIVWLAHIHGSSDLLFQFMLVSSVMLSSVAADNIAEHPAGSTKINLFRKPKTVSGSQAV